ncbi:MAG: cofactor assembly of complex C subunit B [Oscillatoriales cyanobacterium]|nr:MAG: cofactor assembly of complex C subunit B [Oscillatoriales cyanobacterium]
MDSWLSSALIPTSLMAIGLAFFIRASTKERTEELEMACVRSATDVDRLAKDHLTGRTYRIMKSEDGTTLFEGQVRPSVFLAIFLSVLAVIGFACVGLIVGTAIPSLADNTIAIVTLSPLAGAYYWKKANKSERVVIAVQETGESTSSMIAIGHRDELNVLRQMLRSQGALP